MTANWTHRRIRAAFALALSLTTLSWLQPAAAQAEAEWNLLVYINGFNNLDSFGAMDINEMERVGSTDKVQVIVQWASLARKTAQRLRVTRDSDFSRVTSPVIEDLGRIDMGSEQTLVEFVDWAQSRFPSRKTFVVVWNHGSGWQASEGRNRGIERDGLPITEDISFDDLSGNAIKTEQLGTAMHKIAQRLGRPIDIYGSDACLMAMAEVAGEMKGVVRYFVGSQHLEPGEGWEYTSLLTRWNTLKPDPSQPGELFRDTRQLWENPSEGDAPAASVAKIVVETYVDNYTSRAGREITLSAYDLSKWDAFTAAMQGFVRERLSATQPSSLLLAGRNARNYYMQGYRDLGQILKSLGAGGGNAAQGDLFGGDLWGGQMGPGGLTSGRGAVGTLASALNSLVIANRFSQDQDGSSGISVWFPQSAPQLQRAQARYQKLLWNADTQWLSLLQKAHGVASGSMDLPVGRGGWSNVAHAR